MSKGFGKPTPPQTPNLVSDAAAILFTLAATAGKPFVIPMFPPDNDQGLKPGETKLGRNELTPSCDGLVVAVRCSAEDAQRLMDLIADWETRRRGDRNGND